MVVTNDRPQATVGRLGRIQPTHRNRAPASSQRLRSMSAPLLPWAAASFQPSRRSLLLADRPADFDGLLSKPPKDARTGSRLPNAVNLRKQLRRASEIFARTMRLPTGVSGDTRPTAHQSD